jgi:hypothetical protein
MNTRRSTRISNQSASIQLSSSDVNQLVRQVISQHLAKKSRIDLHGYSGKDGFVVDDKVVEQELSFDSDYDEESVKSDDELEEQVDDEDLDLESDSSDTEEEEEQEDDE